ncbi:unnamed protein product [Peronospora belbahrii]|uniref:Uncharacterized protein n=1 Tax=Peronospora belbahrii TaxID=622444 RepID=A0ABN8D1L7_9STRA|nr:unnamed protein product [Peronospora belbahrii]
MASVRALDPEGCRPHDEKETFTTRAVRRLDRRRRQVRRYLRAFQQRPTHRRVGAISAVRLLLRRRPAESQGSTIFVHTYEHNVLAPMHPLHVFKEIELIVYKDVLKLRSKAEHDVTQKLALYLRECLGAPDDQPLSWTAVRDMLTCREAYGVPFPEGIDCNIFKQVETYDTWLWQRLYHRKLLLRSVQGRSEGGLQLFEGGGAKRTTCQVIFFLGTR